MEWRPHHSPFQDFSFPVTIISSRPAPPCAIVSGICQELFGRDRHVEIKEWALEAWDLGQAEMICAVLEVVVFNLRRGVTRQVWRMANLHCFNDTRNRAESCSEHAL